MFYFDPVYFLFALPPMALMLWAQWRVKSAVSAGGQVPANLTGAAAARLILDRAGLNHVRVEPVEGELSDHYDPRSKTLRLSHEIYGRRSAAAVGIAAHEAGHALQDATNYGPLVLRSAAVPAATAGGKLATVAIMGGFILAMLSSGPLPSLLILLGILGYGAVLAFQLINLPVEFDASNRAKRLVADLGIVDAEGGYWVRKCLNAAAWTYVAAAFSTAATMLYYILVYSRMNDRR
ncbi:MAG: zinc metallopeptidase [Planctomycetota bacterium]